jgi:hypothetical protein
VAFMALRMPLCFEPGVRLGWNSDSAIFGLIAREMAEKGTITWFYWGQDYIGTVTSLLAVLAGQFVSDGVGPLALRIATTAELLAGLLFFADALRRMWGQAAAGLMFVMLAAGPAYFFKLGYAPNAEQMFLIGAALFWFVARAPFKRAHHWLVLGMLAGIGWWAHRGAVLVVPAAVIVTFAFDGQWRRLSRASVAAAAFVAGCSIGLVPVALGRAQVDQPLYEPLTGRWSPYLVWERLRETATKDAWMFFGADEHRFAPAVALVVIIVFLIGIRQHTVARNDVFAAGVMITCCAFWILSPIAYSGAMRYLILLLPLVYGVAARGIVFLWQSRGAAHRAAAVIASVVLLSSSYGGRIKEAADVAAGRGEQHEHWPGGFDPRPTLNDIRTGGYDVCYADFWLAYKLEWLSGSRVKFIPYRSVDRTQTRSLVLAQMPGPKCYVALNGRVVALDSVQEARFRAETFAHARRRAH